MPHLLIFTSAYDYETRLTGIEVPVILRHENEATQFSAKIDTGSSFCIFRRGDGEKLGLDIELGESVRINTVTGSFLAYGHELSVTVLGIETTSTVYFAADDNFRRNVLGRQGWLDRIRLGLLDYEGRLYLSAYDEPQ